MPSVWPIVKPIIEAGTSCLIKLPIELIKVRVQLGQGSAGQVALNILKNEGIASFYKGFSAGLFRKISYEFAKPELEKILTSKETKTNDGKRVSHLQMALLTTSVNAGLSFVTSPADLALTRMQADATFAAAQHQNYKNVIHAFYRIVADEGVLALWKGSGPTLVRSLALNAGFFATVFPSASFFNKSLGFDRESSLIAAHIVSGCATSVCGLPFDYIKTQIQTMQPDAKGKYPYTSSFDCAVKTLKSGGLQKFYIGFPLYAVRIGVPQVMLAYHLVLVNRKKTKSAGSRSMR